MALERATPRNPESATDLRYKEAIENLAMIVANPGLLPSYSLDLRGDDQRFGYHQGVHQRLDCALRPSRSATPPTSRRRMPISQAAGW